MVEIEEFPQTSLAEACVCYMCDEGSLFPTLLSAIQVRENVSRQKADVVVYLIGQPTSASELFRPIYTKCGIRFVVVSPNVIEGMRPAFARLFIDRIVEPAYQRILYIDGNTQIAGNIDPLIDVSLPRNTFCAAFDPASLAITYDNRPFPQLFAYFESIGLSASQISRYINAGVLLLDRTSWAEVCIDSLKLLNPTTQRFRFLDQDLINLAADGRCLTMSFKWNFPSFLMSYGFEDVIEPRIYHFMGNPRPWQGAFQPWGRKWHRTYTDLVKKYPDLQPYLKTLPTSKYLKFHAQHHYKKLTEGRVWRRPEIRDKIIEIEKNAFI